MCLSTQTTAASNCTVQPGHGIGGTAKVTNHTSTTTTSSTGMTKNTKKKQQQQQQRVKSEREVMIDKLNERVLKITEREVAKHELKRLAQPNVQLAPEFVHAQIPMTLFQAGYPIYQIRSQYVVYTYTTIATAIILYLCTFVIHPIISLLALVTMFLAYDVYSGILHVVLDHPANIAVPILGQPCLEFQWHHSIPDDIVRKSFLDVCGDMNVVIFILFLFNAYLLPKYEPLALLLGLLKLMMAYFGQYSHKAAHSMGKSLHPVAKWLQQHKLMISVKDHMDHHTPPYTKDYCLIGICNPIIDALRTVTTNNTIWLTVFLVWSILDIYACHILLTKLLSYFHIAVTY
jgi:hypothetical protein